MQRLETKKFKTTLECAKKIMVKEILKEFYKGTIAPPDFGISGKRKERKIDSLLQSAPSDLKT